MCACERVGSSKVACEKRRLLNTRNSNEFVVLQFEKRVGGKTQEQKDSEMGNITKIE